MTKHDPRARKAGKPRRPTADPNSAPFSSFLERDEIRRKRDRARRRTLVISVGVHVVALVILLFYSFFHVDELFAPSVGVKMMSPSKLPPGVMQVQPATPPPAAPAPVKAP